MLLNHNSRPHVSKHTQQTICNLGCQVLPHPAYSSDLTLSDFHLFRSLEHSMRGQSSLKVQKVQKHIDIFLSIKPQSFFRDGIRKLPDRWQMVISSDGNYFD